MQRSAIRLSFLPMATDSCLAAPHAEEYATDAYRHHEARETRREDLLRRGNAQQQDRGGPRDHPATLAHPVVQARSVFVSRIRVDSSGQYLGFTLLVWGCGPIRHASSPAQKVSVRLPTAAGTAILAMTSLKALGHFIEFVVHGRHAIASFSKATTAVRSDGVGKRWCGVKVVPRAGFVSGGRR